MLIILLLSFRVSLASAEGVIGVDLLALQHPLFPLEKIISDVPNGSALGVLLDTFGEDRSKISKALNSGKFSSFRIHLANGPGLRNGQLGIYENLSGLNIRSFEKKIIEGDHILESSFIERAKYVNKLALQFSNAK